MHETIFNLTIVTIVGNLALIGAWAAGGIVWQMAKAWKEK